MTATNAPGLLALLIGIYHIANSISAFADPARWPRMANEMIRSPFKQLVGGFLALSLGFAVVSLVNWNDDWFSRFVYVLGALSCLKGITLIAFPQAVLSLSLRMMSVTGRLFTLVQAAFGVVLTLLAIARV